MNRKTDSDSPHVLSVRGEAQVSTDLERVSRLWDQTAADRAAQPVQGWLDCSIVLENYVQPKITGSSHLNWLVGLMKRARVPKGGRWLSLGCGAADQEVLAAKEGLFSCLLALDASPLSIQRARETAAREGVTSIEFGGVDFNSLSLPSATYDVVLMGMSLHHVLELGYVLSQVRTSLKRDGFLLINEFIGPRQFQFSDLQLSIVRELLDALPPNLRRDLATGGIKTEYVRMPVEYWNFADPSEAIRSDVIVREVQKQFRIVARVDYGGTILNLLLEHIAHNFDQQNEKDVAIIRLLATTEDLLIQLGVLPSDFAVMAMQKRRFPGRVLAALRSIVDPTTVTKARALAGMARGRLKPSTATAMVDFRSEAGTGAIASGFYHWERGYRWMGQRGEIVLRMASNQLTVIFRAPLAEVGRRHPDWSGFDVRVDVQDVGSGKSVALGSISAGDDVLQSVLPIPESFGTAHRDQPVLVRLECDRVWIPAETIPGSEDTRSLTVQVMQIGFASEKLPKPGSRP